MRDLWVEWLQEKQRRFFYGILMVVATLFIAFWLFGKFHTPQNSSFLATKELFNHWLATGSDIDKLQVALENDHDMDQKFGALVAERLIVQNEGDLAQPFAERVFERVLGHIPNYTTFSEGSLLIAQGKLNEALRGSVALQTHLESASLLTGFNLVRIVSLYAALKAPGEEAAAIEELEGYLQDNPKKGQVLNDCFTSGSITLVDYLEQRKSLAAQAVHH